MVYMQNRELSWLAFNERVLQEAARATLPLVEKLKFIAIFTSNLDEFFMVRVGVLTDYALYEKKYQDNKTGLTAQEQLDEIFKAVIPLYQQRDNLYASVTADLALQGLPFLKMAEVSPEGLKTLKKYFTRDIMPLLSPQIIDTRHPFPHLANKQLHIAVTIEKKKGPQYGLIALPAQIDRLLPLEGEGLVLLEDLIYHFAQEIFGTYKVSEKNIIAVTRNADINTEEDMLDEDIDYRQHMKNLLKKRRRLAAVRLECVYEASPAFLTFFCDKLHLEQERVFFSAAPLELSFCWSLNRAVDRERLKNWTWPAHVPAKAQSFKSSREAKMLKTAAEKDILLSYPYESIAPFLALIQQAAEDTSVLSIKITLYRIDVHSKLAESLILAAENGKEVVVLMELRARFDEQNNIEWAQRLEEAGCRVVYGLPVYKVHSKVCLITRVELGTIQYIIQIGTGNYNEKTASLYTDYALITANPELGRDANALFRNMLLGSPEEGVYTHLWVAPSSLKNNILRHIDLEREKAEEGGEGRIIIKCNSLTDKEIIEKLVEAAQSGVKIDMIIRGICCLIPQIPGVTENIRVISIVGQFLEHTRVFCFGTGAVGPAGPSQKIYISSADLMTRNTQRRVEVACPILDADLKKRITDMLEIMLADNTQAWELFAGGKYVQRKPKEGETPLNSQAYFVEEARAERADITAPWEEGTPSPTGLKGLWKKLKGKKMLLSLLVLLLFAGCANQADTYYEEAALAITAETAAENNAAPPELEVPDDAHAAETNVEFLRVEGEALWETSFESGLDGAAGRGGGRVQRTTRQSHSGDYAVFVSGRYASWHGVIIDVTRLSASHYQYEFSAWVMPVDTAVQFQLTVQYTQDGHQLWRHFAGNTASVTAQPGQWTELRGNLTWYEADQFHLIIETDGAGANAAFYVDDILFRDISPVLVFADLPALQEVYRDYFYMGVALMPVDMQGIRREVKTHHFSSFTAGNDFKPAYTQPQPGVFNFSVTDRFVEMAQEAGNQKVGHTLVWHTQSPDWMNPAGIDREEAIRNLEGHITELVTRYRGQVAIWDVVNEAFPSYVPLAAAADWRANLRQTPWLAAIGYDYIEMAFRAAHAANPYAILIYNDYNLDFPGKREAVFHMLQELLERGTPIHGVGMQGHYSLTTRHSDVEASILRFAELGIPVHFTEVDVTVQDALGQEWLTPEQELRQAIFYARLFQIFRRHHTLIYRVTFWGLDDASSWRSERFPLLFNRDLTPKLAFYAVIDPEGFLLEHEVNT